jgi:hypothetical protein
MRMRVLICGGRDFRDGAMLSDALVPYRGKAKVVIHGDATGADRLADKWGKIWGALVLPFPADWTTHGRAAGPIRNQQMIDEGKPDIVIAFPGGRGTADMVRRAEKAGIEVIRPVPLPTL